MLAVLGHILGFYSNVAVAWVGAVTADLVIGKPILKLGPSYIEFKRAHLHNFNPVGFGSMMFASVISVIAFFGYFGVYAQSYSCFIALALAFIASPIICVITQGKYYLARTSESELREHEHDSMIACISCEYEYEKKDMVYCPFHTGPICSLCCSLEGACHDVCKEEPATEARPATA